MRWLRLLEQGFDVFPVHEMVDESLQIIRTAIAVVDVIRMLPHVDAEDRRRAVHQRAFTVRGLRDFELAILDRQPSPARTELTGASGGEVGLELLKTAEILVDFLGELTGSLSPPPLGFIQFQKCRWL
jgi:hypothetical protein